MECNIEEIGGQIVEPSNGKNVIRAPIKDEKEWQDWLQDFQLKSNSAWIARNTFPSCSRATFRKGYVCQHSDFNEAVHSSKRSKNTVCNVMVTLHPFLADFLHWRTRRTLRSTTLCRACGHTAHARRTRSRQF
jgi:hypothetical protein